MSSATTRPQMQGPHISPFRKRQMSEDVIRIQSTGGSVADVANHFYTQYGYKMAGYEPPPDPTPEEIRKAYDPEMQVTVGLGTGTYVPLSFSLGFFNGITVGAGDEGVGSLYGWSQGQSAQWGRDQYRQLYEGLNEHHPVSTAAGEVTGMVAAAEASGAAGLARKAAQGAGWVKKGLMGGALGAGTGAVYGATSEGDIAQRGQATLEGGGLGGGLGVVTAVSPVVALMGMGAVGGALMSDESPVKGAAIGAGSVLLASKAAKPVANTVLEYFQKLRGLPASERAPAVASRAFWANLITRKYGSIDKAIAAVDRMASDGVPTSMFEMAGDEGVATVKQLSNEYSPGVRGVLADLNTRQADQQNRIATQAVRAFRVGTSNAYDAADALVASREAAAADDFARALDETVPLTDDIKRVLRVPEVQEAYEAGRRLHVLEVAEQTEGRGTTNIPSLFSAPPDVASPSFVDAAGNPLVLGKGAPSMPDRLPVRALHYIKLGFRDIAEQAANSGKAISRQRQRPFFGFARQARDYATAHSDTYRAALSTFAGYSEEIEAIQMGKGGSALVEAADDVVRPRFINRPPEIIRREMATLAPNQKTNYRLGALQDLDQLLSESQSPDVVKRLGIAPDGTRETQVTKGIRALFEDDGLADELITRLRREAQISRTSAAAKSGGLRGLVREYQQVAGLSSPMMAKSVGVAMRVLGGGASAGWTGSVADEIANIGLKGVNGGPTELKAAINSLRPWVRSYRPAVPMGAGQQAGLSRRPKSP